MPSDEKRLKIIRALLETAFLAIFGHCDDCTAPRRLRMRLIGPQKMQLRLRSLMAGATERCRQCDLSFLTDSENVPMS